MKTERFPLVDGRCPVCDKPRDAVARSKWKNRSRNLATIRIERPAGWSGNSWVIRVRRYNTEWCVANRDLEFAIMMFRHARRAGKFDHMGEPGHLVNNR